MTETTGRKVKNIHKILNNNYNMLDQINQNQATETEDEKWRREHTTAYDLDEDTSVIEELKLISGEVQGAKKEVWEPAEHRGRGMLLSEVNPDGVIDGIERVRPKSEYKESIVFPGMDIKIQWDCSMNAYTLIVNEEVIEVSVRSSRARKLFEKAKELAGSAENGEDLIDKLYNFIFEEPRDTKLYEIEKQPKRSTKAQMIMRYGEKAEVNGMSLVLRWDPYGIHRKFFIMVHNEDYFPVDAVELCTNFHEALRLFDKAKKIAETAETHSDISRELAVGA